MKSSILSFAIIVCTLVSCRKDQSAKISTGPTISVIKEELLKQLGQDEWRSLDFKKVLKAEVDDKDFDIIRIGFKNHLLSERFVILKFNKTNQLVDGKIISLKVKLDGHFPQGIFSVFKLNDSLDFNAHIIDGFIIRNAGPSSQKIVDVPESGETLPGVVVVGTYRKSGGMDWSTWYSLQSLFDSPFGSDYTGVYVNSEGSQGGGGSEKPQGEAVLNIDFDSQYSSDPIALDKFMSCFDQISDLGATGSIEIFTDIPVNGDPSKFFDWSNGSPGHTFIQLRKSNGTSSISQNIGFYPKAGWKTVASPGPTDGKFVDNEGHEYNASYKVNLTPLQIHTAITRILSSRSSRYDIDEYNCTDWALNIFNETVDVSKQLNIKMYDIPGGESIKGTSTPNALFEALTKMGQSGEPFSEEVSLPVIGWVGQSHGPCNDKINSNENL